MTSFTKLRGVLSAVQSLLQRSAPEIKPIGLSISDFFGPCPKLMGLAAFAGLGQFRVA